MSERKRHEYAAAACPLCEEKLKDAHPWIAEWFRTKVKKSFPDAHIAWSFRSQEEQDRMVAEHKSFTPWPTSRHNKTFPSGYPAAEALDLFQLTRDGAAAWPVAWYQRIFDSCGSEGIRWGGKFEKLRDWNHFEIDESKMIRASGR